MGGGFRVGWMVPWLWPQSAGNDRLTGVTDRPNDVTGRQKPFGRPKNTASSLAWATTLGRMKTLGKIEQLQLKRILERLGRIAWKTATIAPRTILAPLLFR